VVQNLGVLYHGKNLIDALAHTVKKDVIKDIFPVVQNLCVLYQGKNWIDALAHCKKRCYKRYLFSGAEPGCAVPGQETLT
jgi:hypothetical protein